MGSNMSSEINEWIDTTTTSNTTTVQNNEVSLPKSLVENSSNSETNIDAIPFDERPLPSPKQIVKRKIPKSITFIKPRDSIYVLLKDDTTVCFSTNKKDIIRMIRFYKTQITRINKKLFSVVEDNVLNIYERNNFIFNYNRLISSLKIVKIPHFRTQMFVEKEFIKQL